MRQAIRRFMVCEAATFIVAALIHFGVLATGFGHQRAGTAESVIAVALLTGFAWSLAPGRSIRLIGLTAQGFALMGTLVGVFMIAIGVGPRTVPDIAYHVIIVIILISGLIVAARAEGRALTNPPQKVLNRKLRIEATPPCTGANGQHSRSEANDEKGFEGLHRDETGAMRYVLLW
jgi:hypothetical protein